MIKPITPNSESESQEELFDNIIEDFTTGRKLRGKEQFQALPEATMMSFLKYLSERPDKADIHGKLVLELENHLK